MEVSAVRRHVLSVITSARARAQERRERADAAQAAYEPVLERILVPIARQVTSVLRAEGHPFTVSTPGRSVRISSDHGRDDYLELSLRTDVDPPTVVGRVRRVRGSRTIDEERPVRTDTPPQDLTEEDVLEFIAAALEPWLEP